MKLFVWDLHGTLEKGNDRAVIDISNHALSRFGYEPRFSYDDGRALYGLKWYEYFEWLIPSLTHEESKRLQEACFEISELDVEIQLRWLEPTDYALEVLSKVGSQHRQIIVSNTRPANLSVFLRVLGLDTYFATDSAFAVNKHDRNAANSKSDVVDGFIKQYGPYDETIVIGDSRSDMRLAELGATTFLYAHPGFEFPDCPADHHIRDLRLVLDTV